MCDRYAPTVSMRQKQRGVPWINDDYLVLARQRDCCRKQFGKTKLISWWHKYQYFRNRANNLNRFLKKKNYYQKEKYYSIRINFRMVEMILTRIGRFNKTHTKEK